MRTILVVDDNPYVVDVFSAMLEMGGYRPIPCQNGKECLEILKSNSPDLILLDIMMKPMDGWETLEKIRENPTTKDIPVIMLTAKQLTPQEAVERGKLIEDYVVKPLTNYELWDAVERVLSRWRNIRYEINLARQFGIDQESLIEYCQLSKSIDVNKRLMSTLETIYHFNKDNISTNPDFPNSLKMLQSSISLQEQQLLQIREKLKNYPELQHLLITV